MSLCFAPDMSIFSGRHHYTAGGILFLRISIFIYHTDNDVGLCEDKRAREGMEDGSFLPGRILSGGTNRGT